MNMQIKSFFYIAGVIGFAAFVLLLYTTNTLSHYYKMLENMGITQYETRLTADMLRQSSDDLTKFARLYVVTGDGTYKEDYNRVLYIRNGELPIPSNYQNIYWDLLEPIRTQRHPNERKMAFANIIERLPYDRYELKKLEEAKENSDDLANLEIEAFSAMAGLFKDSSGKYAVYGQPDQKRAIAILHSVSYLKAKQKIMLPIDEFCEHLDQRMQSEMNFLKVKVEALYKLLWLLSFFIGSVLIMLTVLVHKKIIQPIVFLREVIANFRDKKPIERKFFYRDEIGFMTEEFFMMHDELEEDIKLIGKNKRQMQEYLILVDKNVITSTTDLNGKILSTSEAFTNISGYSKEELIGNNHRIVRHPDMPKELYKDLWNTIINNQKWEGEIKNRSKDGATYWVKTTIYPNYDETGTKIGYISIRLDITAKKQVEALLEESKINEKMVQEYVKLVDQNILTSTTDISGKIIYVSEAFARISGYNKDELIGYTHRVVKHEDNDPQLYENMWETISHNRIWHGVIKNKKKDGGFYWVDATIYPVFNSYGEKSGYTAIRIDITDKKRVEELLIVDALTGVYNRRHFNEIFPRAINTAKRERKYISLIILDIDHFKQYNDTYGHQEGDEALIKVAHALKAQMKRATDLCFRLGGEEFGVVFESLSPDEAFAFADDIRASVEALTIEHRNNTAGAYVTVSAGLVTRKTVNSIDPDMLYKAADELLYQAKESGRNRVKAN